MPISFAIDHKLGIIREAWTGVITVEEVRRHWTQYLTDPEILALRASLADLRGAQLDFGAWQMRQLIETVVDPLLRGRDWITALVLTGFHQLEMAQKYQELAEHYSHDAIFFDEYDALEWLVGQRAKFLGAGRSPMWGEQPGERSRDPH